MFNATENPSTTNAFSMENFQADYHPLVLNHTIEAADLQGQYLAAMTTLGTLLATQTVPRACWCVVVWLVD